MSLADLRYRARSEYPDKVLFTAQLSKINEVRKISFTLTDGEELTLYQSTDGTWCCPVCGSVALVDQPYYQEGGASFEMCHGCGFEFGFDDDPLATASAASGIQNNWLRWRKKLLAGAIMNKPQYGMLVEQLKNIDASPIDGSGSDSGPSRSGIGNFSV